jgi:hypothetical protein
MARQIGLLQITGTASGICFYRMNDAYYARKKSSLSGERVKKDPVFKETMRHANLFAKASSIGSKVYKALYPGTKNRELYQQLTGRASCLLQEGLNEEETLSVLLHVPALRKKADREKLC